MATYLIGDSGSLVPLVLWFVVALLPFAVAATSGTDLVDQLGELIPLRDVPSLLPRGRGGKRIHIATVYRWTDPGCRGIRLRYAQLGATRCTTRAWLAEFMAALTAAGTDAQNSPPARTPAARRREYERAERALDQMGV